MRPEQRQDKLTRDGNFSCARPLLAVAALAAGWLACGSAKAGDIGTGFTYQGSLERSGGPVSETCDFRFRLYSVNVGGSEVGASPQDKTGVAVSGGVFTIEGLDFGPAGIDGTARWLAIEVKCPGDAGFILLSPRVELKPAPHAIHAERAAGLRLPYIEMENVAMAEPMLELTQTGQGPAAIFKVQPQPEPPLPQPAIEAISETTAPALQATSLGSAIEAVSGHIGPPEFPTIKAVNTGSGSAAELVSAGIGGNPDVPTLKVEHLGDGPAATFATDPEMTPAPAIKVTNSGLGSAIEAVSGHIGPPDLPTIKATNVGVGMGLEVSSGELSVSGAPTLRATNIGVGTAMLAVSTTGTAIHAVSGNNDAGFFEGSVTVTDQIGCASLVWGSSALGDDQGGAIELGNSLTLGNNPYIDFHRGVGLAQDFSVRLINDSDGKLKVDGGLHVTGTLELEQELTVSGDLTIDTGGLTVSSGDLAIDSGDLTLSGHMVVSSSDSTPTVLLTNTGAGSALHVVGTISKAYTTGTSNQAVPIAYATIDLNGTVTAGTPNVSALWDSGNQRYAITIAGETYSTTTHVTTVTPIVTGAPEALFATTSSGSGQLRIRIMSVSTGTTGLQRPFQFITYKP